MEMWRNPTDSLSCLLELPSPVRSALCLHHVAFALFLFPFARGNVGRHPTSAPGIPKGSSSQLGVKDK